MQDSHPEFARPVPTLLGRREFMKIASLGIGVVGVGGGLLSACGTSTTTRTAAKSAAMSPVTVQLNWIENVQFAGTFAADRQGFMRSEHITQHVIPGGTTVDSMTVVGEGRALVGSAPGNVLFYKAVAAGVPVKAFAATYQRTPLSFVSLAAHPVKTLDDLIGKRLGLQTGGRGPWETIVAANHFPAAKVTIVPVGVDSAQALATGQVDAILAFPFNQAVALEVKGIKTYQFPASVASFDYYSDLLVATNSTIAKQHSLLARWLRATVEGWEYALANQAAIAKYTVDRSPTLGLNLKQQVLESKEQAPYLRSSLTAEKGLLWMTSSVWEKGLDLLKKLGQAPSSMTVSQLMTTSILEEAYNGKTSLPD